MAERTFLVPLDSRPANTDMPERMSASAGIAVDRPPLSVLGSLRRPADIPAVRGWLEESLRAGVRRVILSTDMLAYGGLVASRSPATSLRDAERNLSFVKKLKKKYSDLEIYAFGVIPRDATTAADSESFRRWSEQMRGADTKAAAAARPGRERNFRINMNLIEWAAEGALDFFALGKEDTAAGNPNSAEIEALDAAARAAGGDRAAVLTGADELAQIMLARCFLRRARAPLKFFIDCSRKDMEIVPLYEPGPIGENIRMQIMCAGGVEADSAADADAVLLPAVSRGAEDLFLAQLRGGRAAPDEVPHALLEKIGRHARAGRAVGLIDALRINGSSPALVEALLNKKLFFRLAGYAGWNTASNSSGTVVAQTALAAAGAREVPLGSARANNRAVARARFMLDRLAEDYVFSAFARGELARRLESPMDMKYTEDVRLALNERMELRFGKTLKRAFAGGAAKVYAGGARALSADVATVRIHACLPWKRLFEARIDLDVRLRMIDG
ncbi:MAG TPA: DUF4127 family protein [bacterium]|nr:DUF4127 family protein [bacterium]